MNWASACSNSYYTLLWDEPLNSVALRTDIASWIMTWNANNRLFNWTMKAADMSSRTKRYRAHLSISQERVFFGRHILISDQHFTSFPWLHLGAGSAFTAVIFAAP